MTPKPIKLRGRNPKHPAARMAVLIANMELRHLVALYRRHEAWARRSGYAAMDWSDFKRTRIANPLCRAGIVKATEAK